MKIAPGILAVMCHARPVKDIRAMRQVLVERRMPAVADRDHRDVRPVNAGFDIATMERLRKVSRLDRSQAKEFELRAAGARVRR
ncbi:hypothetical protein Tdes44962_MAKER09465 [Teratosphaeria destructans]|uniref:Uncharacterized protein n=1 Tax=Teratosphaeria destructans TaxID=418781 RepID=A0A9W7STM0_9PEZI|nr:hypothetical protein Tdes44962_MAKER09465 [Teratosphaeria destructans]